MVTLVIKKISLTLRIIKLIFIGVFKVVLGKSTLNDLLARLEMNKVETRLRFWKTIYFNFRTMPAREAWKTPVWIYGKTYFYNLSGSCVPLKGTKVRPGTFVIGHMDQTRSCDTITSITLKGKLYYGNNIVLRQGAKLKIGGRLILEDNVYIGDNNTFMIDDSCTIGSKTRVANNCTFMDTDIHYIIDVNTGVVNPNLKPITIGEGNWIGAYTMIKKGVQTPRFMITVGPYACLTKNYIKDIPEYACMGGCPAKLIKVGLRRVNNKKSERIISSHYDNSNDAFVYQGDIDSFCSPC